jgi:two-component system chemotaxis response regulator CheY
MKILIVENSLRVRRMMRNLLTGIVNEVFECTNGYLALAAYQAHQPDWVLMDVELKYVDGIAATKLIKADFPNARIAIVTDYDDPAMRRAAQQAGACAYVLKENLFELRALISGRVAAEQKETGNLR